MQLTVHKILHSFMILFLCIMLCHIPAQATTALTTPDGTWIRSGSEIRFQRNKQTYVKSKHVKINGRWFSFK